ncbi:hypothetical protein EV182_001509 [Spiromyces aspiralis]|uniref:Uncharacterized protein n=1 Tax=Spiromyces aspiralis TaxID=68401 RepID=A0ACC1HH17_9FUNG|nr:hypothetical protein EV182_001509 [Spiromyces aspiralis]
MGKSTNPADAHRRIAHKREIKKASIQQVQNHNKELRKQARENSLLYKDTTKIKKQIERYQQLGKCSQGGNMQEEEECSNAQKSAANATSGQCGWVLVATAEQRRLDPNGRRRMNELKDELKHIEDMRKEKGVVIET